MKKAKKVAIIAILVALSAFIIVSVPVLLFINDFQNAIYLKDYERLEKYLNDISVITETDGVVELNSDIHDTEGGPYVLFIKDREYTKPRLIGIEIMEGFSLRLFFAGRVSFDDIQGGHISYAAHIDVLSLGVEIIRYENG